MRIDVNDEAGADADELLNDSEKEDEKVRNGDD